MMTIATVILAGGQSRRMGQDKALLTLDGEPLIRRMSRHALACASAVYVVTPWPDRYRPLLPPNIQFIPETRDLDVPSPGPLAALTTALDQLLGTGNPDDASDPDWILALACDLPNINAAILQGWSAELEAVAADSLAYLPHHQGRWEPLCGFYRPACVPSWQTYLAQGRRSFQGWLNHNLVQAIPDIDPQWLVNLNTPVDLDAWRGE